VKYLLFFNHFSTPPYGPFLAISINIQLDNHQGASPTKTTRQGYISSTHLEARELLGRYPNPSSSDHKVSLCPTVILDGFH
jgi:hypothetical protein